MVFGDFSLEILLGLALIALLAGFIDTLAGGGGLLTIPALIISGLPPLLALGTNKLQGSMGTATSTFMMFKNKKIKWHDVKSLMLTAFIGSAVGTIIIQFINTQLLSFVIPVVLLMIGIYFLFSSNIIQHETKPKISQLKYKNIIVPIIGCYDGMFGPGTGSFFSLAAVSLRGFKLINAAIMARPLNFSTNIAALIVFLMAGQIVWSVGAAMMVGQALGAWLGSHCLFKINTQYLRVLVVVMCFSMLFKYIYSMEWFVA